jgi:hypothetical protein
MGSADCDRGKGFHRIRNLVYILIGALLIALSLFSLFIACNSLLEAILNGKSQLTVLLLTSVGLVVLALALFDVGKYLIEEEVIHERELTGSGDARRRLTKFLTILVIALGLESLVYVFKVGRAGYGEEAGGAGLEHLVYPTLLIVGIGFLLVALGWYQYLSSRAESLEGMRSANEPTETEAAKSDEQ